MRNKKATYKVQIDKDALRTFLKTGDYAIAEKQLRQVVFLVLKTHFSNYMDDREEFEAMCIDYLYSKDRIKQYDPTYDAYTYLYTIFRNCIGNYVSKQKRSVAICEDIVNDGYGYEETGRERDNDLPDDVTDMILGDSDEDFIALKPRDAIMVGVVCYTPSRMTNVLSRLMAYRTPTEIAQALIRMLAAFMQRASEAKPTVPQAIAPPKPRPRKRQKPQVSDKQLSLFDDL